MTQFLELRFPFAYDEVDKEYWEKLLKNIDKTKLDNFSFETFVRTSFNKVKFDAADVIAEWTNATASTYDRWLLRNYVQYTGFAELYPYINMCINTATDLSDENQLSYMIATRILYADIPLNKKSEYALERRNVIADNAYMFDAVITTDEKKWLFERIKETFQQDGNLNSVLDLCTGVFDFEKKLLMGWSVFYPNNKKLADAVGKLYPDYEAYLLTNKPIHFNTSCQWFIDYLKAYKHAKVKDVYTDEVRTVIKSQNDSVASFYKWYYDFSSSHEILSEMSNNNVLAPDRIYWIDGLGAEFMSYILYLIEQEKSNLKIVRSEFTRSELPSSTHHNRFEGANVVKYGNLDELGHDSHGYKPFDTLIEELKVIKSIIQEIVTTCKKEKCTIAIVSDHGLSCLSRKAPSKKYEGKIEHEGRYIKTSEDAQDDPDYIVHKNNNDGICYKVALTHSSLSKVPIHQVHGGCTPEEVVVPFLLLSNKNVASNLATHTVKMSGEDIMLSDPVVRVTIIPEPKAATLTCEGKTYKMDRVNTTWIAKLDNITEGAHVVDIKPEGANSTEITINVVGVGVNSDINDMFDL